MVGREQTALTNLTNGSAYSRRSHRGTVDPGKKGTLSHMQARSTAGQQYTCASLSHTCAYAHPLAHTEALSKVRAHHFTCARLRARR